MSELESKTIMVSLVFTNEVVEVSGNCGCIFIRELLDCCDSHNNKFKIFKHSKLFKKFILNNFETKNLRNYNSEQFEELFLEFGYYGYTKGINKLRRLYKKIILERVRNTKSIRKLFRKNIHRVKCTKALCSNPNVTGKFIEKMGILDMKEISMSETLPFSFIKKHLEELISNNFYSGSLANNKNLNEDFFGTFKKYVNWRSLSTREDFSERFFSKYIKRFNMFQLIKNPAISEAFVRKHEVYIRETITTQMMWSNPNLSETFVNERLDEVDWDTLVANNQVLDEKFYMKHQHKLDNNEIIGNMAANSKISLEYIMSNVNEHLMDDEYFWHCIFRRRSDLKLEFLEKYFKKIGLEICLNSNVPIEFFLKYPQFQNNYFFQDNSLATSEMLHSYIKRIPDWSIDWNIISRSPACDEAFVEIYKNEIDWHGIIRNKFRAEKQVDWNQDPLSKYL